MPRVPLLLGLVLVCLLPAPAAAQEADHLFQRAIEAFRNQDFARAAELFQKARAAGMESPVLSYNLGATYYRLGRLAKARTAFRRLLGGEDDALAHYNLGLIARKRGRPQAARRHFRATLAAAPKEELDTLAQQALDETEVPAPGPAGYLSLALGYEDNVTLSPEEVVDATGTGDQFLEGLGVLELPLDDSGKRRLDLSGSLYLLDYRDLSAYDLTHLRAGPDYEIREEGWRLSVGGAGSLVLLDREEFQRIATLEAGIAREPTPTTRVSAGLQAEWIDAREPYAYLSGTRQRFTVTGHNRRGWGRLQGGYRLTLNDRDDLATGTDFASFSPTRHELFLSVRRSAGPWEGSLETEYRLSRYNDPHVQAGRSETRRDRRYRVVARLGRDLPRRLQVFGRYSHTRNDSNLNGPPFTDYGYTSRIFLVGLERAF